MMNHLLDNLDLFLGSKLPLSANSYFSYLGFALFLLISTTFLINSSLWFMQYVFSKFTTTFNVRASGKWALVTGASDGIGKEYVMRLAEQGMNIILVARNMDKLKKVAQEAEQRHRVQTKIILIDFETADRLTTYEEVRQVVSQVEVGLLVNNVGIMPNRFQRLHEMPYKRAVDLINVNDMSAVLITLSVIPEMVERRNGIIINVASSVGRFSMPFINVYSATKAFHRYFSLAITSEYSDYGITVQCVNPGVVRTKLAEGFLSSCLFAPLAVSTKSCVHAALNQLGKYKETFAHPFHSLQYEFVQGLPFGLGSKSVVMSMELAEKFR